MGKKHPKHRRELKGIQLDQGRNVILFDDQGEELGPPTGSRQQKRAEMRRRLKEMERVLREHDRETVNTRLANAAEVSSKKS